MEILIKNLQQGDKKTSGIIEMLSNYGVEYSVLQPVLQQTDCSTLRELLVQLSNEEQKAWVSEQDDFLREQRKLHIESIHDVIQIIDARQPVA